MTVKIGSAIPRARASADSSKGPRYAQNIVVQSNRIDQAARVCPPCWLRPAFSDQYLRDRAGPVHRAKRHLSPVAWLYYHFEQKA